MPTTLTARTRPRDRFDDPNSEYAVWYLASALRGAMIEVLDHFRVVPSIDPKLAAVKNVQGIDILDEEVAGSVPTKFLSEQRVVKATIAEVAPPDVFVNVMDERVLAELSLHPLVRDALVEGGTENFGPNPTLNFGTLQSASRAARALTQAVSRAVYTRTDTPRGIRYISRHTEDEECWALFDDDDRPAKIAFSEPEFLDPTNDDHLEAVRSAATLLHLRLPDGWA